MGQASRDNLACFREWLGQHDGNCHARDEDASRGVFGVVGNGIRLCRADCRKGKTAAGAGRRDRA